MTPVNLWVNIQRFAGSRNTADSRRLLVTQIVVERTDWRVTLFWPGGVGEVDFELSTGRAWKRRGERTPWRMTADSAREVLRVGKLGGLFVSKSIDHEFWWAKEAAACG